MITKRQLDILASSGRKFAKKSSIWNLLRALRAAEHVYPFWEEMGNIIKNAGSPHLLCDIRALSLLCDDLLNFLFWEKM